MSDESGQADEIRRYSFLRVFANDGTIDSGELAFIERLAMKDGQIDDDERAALTDIFSRVTQDSVAPEVWTEIEDFKVRHGLA